MIESQKSMPDQNGPVPSSINSYSKATPPKPPQTSSKKMPIIIISVVLFVLALAGGFFAIRSLNKQEKVDLTETQPTYAWAPTSVDGTCVGGRVISNPESVPFDYEFVFSVRDVSLQHTFRSKEVNGKYKIDEDFTWSQLGAEGAAFGAALRTGDQVNWTVKVTYTINGRPTTENHGYFFKIKDTSCGENSSPSPSPTAIVTASPSASAVATKSPSPSATAKASASPTSNATTSPKATATVTASASATATASPIAQTTTTPKGTPRTDLTDGRSDNLGCSVNDCSGNKKADNTAVAQSSTGDLPAAGINNSIVFVIFGFVSIAISAVFALRRKKYY